MPVSLLEPADLSVPKAKKKNVMYLAGKGASRRPQQRFHGNPLGEEAPRANPLPSCPLTGRPQRDPSPA